MFFSPTDIGSSSHRGSYFTPGTLKAFRVSLVKPVAYLSCSVTIAEIKAKQDILISYLEHSFDERAKNFQLLFQRVDQSMSSGDNQQLALILHTIVELAKSSPFKDLADLSTVQLALKNPDHVWEI